MTKPAPSTTRYAGLIRTRVPALWRRQRTVKDAEGRVGIRTVIWCTPGRWRRLEESKVGGWDVYLSGVIVVAIRDEW